MQQQALLVLLFTSYFLATLNRRAFQYAIPLVHKETWINETGIGLILSMQTSGYTISKFFSGIAVDHWDSQTMLLLCVFSSSVVTSLLALSRLVWLSCLLALISGLILGMSWPCIGKIVRVRIPPSSFGFSWVLISCSMNVACMVGPLATTFIAHHSHWSVSMLSIASVSFAFGVLIYVLLNRNSGFGLPPVVCDNTNCNPAPSLWAICSNPVILALSFGYFSISILRYTASDWIPLYLIKERGFSQVFASGFASSLETGGIAGSFLAIRISDSYMRKRRPCLNPRLPCIVILTMIACNAAYIVAKHADPTQKLLMTFTAFFLGVSIYGPCSLYGVAAVEAVPSSVSGSSHTIVALAANVGAIMAGYPISALSALIGWSMTLYLVIIVISVSGVVLYAARNATSLAATLKIE